MGTKLPDRAQAPSAPIMGSLWFNCVIGFPSSQVSLDYTGTCCIITGPPTHSVGAKLVTVAGVYRRLSSLALYCGTT